MLLDQLHGFNAVGPLCHHLHAAHLAEQVPELVAGQLFVVDDERGEVHAIRMFDCRQAARLYATLRLQQSKVRSAYSLSARNRAGIWSPASSWPQRVQN